VAAQSVKGAGIGAAAGAAAGMIGVLMSRGPDALLERGSTLEMVLDRDLTFTGEEIDFANAPPSRRNLTEGGEQRSQKRSVLGSPIPVRRF
jgi:type IV secretion system protein VirB10